MYRGSGQLWNGLDKKVHEGLASPGMIVPAEFLLLGGEVLSVLLPAWAWASPTAAALTAGAAVLAYLPRLLAAWRFRQSLLGVLLHPVGIALLVLIQWYALVRN